MVKAQSHSPPLIETDNPAHPRKRISGVIVIFNRGAGNGEREAEKQTARLFRESGAAVEIVGTDESTNLTSLARAALRDGHNPIIAAGGDGTVSAVAAELVDSGKTFGVLPLGTLNHFAKDLQIPLGLDAGIAAILGGHVADVDAGEVNGRIFVNNSSLGIYPRIVARRAAQQERLGRGKWPAFAWATLQALHRYPYLNLHITIEGKQLTRETAFLFVGNNEYELAGFKLGARRCLNSGKLGLYVTRGTGRVGLLRLALRALFGRLSDAKDFDAFCVTEARIETHRRRILVATDGEVNSMETPLHYRIRQRALRVLVPPERPPG